jgi:hypothetical protein
VCTLPYAARIGVRYEGSVEERVELAVERVVQKPIVHARFVNVTGFRVGDFEGVVAAVFVDFVLQIAMEGENVVHQSVLEFLHVCFLALPSQKLLPRVEQILN